MRSALHLAGILSVLVVINHARPQGEVSDDGEKSYIKFFNLEELIQKISFRKFKEFQRTAGENSIPSIDLTQEAIVNDFENPEDSIEVEVIQDVTESVEQESPSIETTTAIDAVDIAGKKMGDDTLVEPADDAVKEEEDNSGGSAAIFFISDESVQAAKKYGYKILLKKISGKVVPVGKIKFEFPTLIEIDPDADEPEQVEPDTANDNDESKLIVTDKIVEDEVEETTQLIADNSAVTTTEQSIESSTETVTTTVEPIITETTTQEEIIRTTMIETEEPVSITSPSPRYLPPAEYYLAPEELEDATEVISTYVSSEGENSDNPVIEAVLKMAEDAEAVVNIINDLDTEAEVSLPNCAVPVDQVKEMLLAFVESVETVLPLIQEVLDIGSGLATADTEGRARIGAELLAILESVLEKLVPFQIPGCSADDSTSLLVSMSSLASQLDSLANVEPNQRKSKSLHDKATSLQLSSWVMVQLKHAVKLFYSQDGICRTDSSPPSTILDTLSKAVAGYAPVTAIIGNQESVTGLIATAEALKETANEIAKLEEAGFIDDPRVPCNASFAEMGQAVSSMADAIP